MLLQTLQLVPYNQHKMFVLNRFCGVCNTTCQHIYKIYIKGDNTLRSGFFLLGKKLNKLCYRLSEYVWNQNLLLH